VAADSTLAGGPGSRPHRRLGSVAVMLAGAGILQLSQAAVIALAAILVAAVGGTFATAIPDRAPRSPAPRGNPSVAEAAPATVSQLANFR
jgi:hypothetical protein